MGYSYCTPTNTQNIVLDFNNPCNAIPVLRPSHCGFSPTLPQDRANRPYTFFARVGKAPYTVTRSEVQHCHCFRVLPEGIRRLTLDGVADAKVRAWLGRMLVVSREERALLGELGRGFVEEEEDDTTAGG